MNELYAHQRELIELDPKKRGVAFGCGCGKTKTVLELCQRAGGKTLVVAPKTQVLDRTWEREREKWGYDLDMTVISKERFKKEKPPCDNLVLDEGHHFLGVTSATRYRNKVEVPKASQLFEELDAYVKEQKPKRIYIASATPFPQPLALWAAGTIFGEDWDYFAFRRKFYRYVPTIGRGIWTPKRDQEHEALLRALAHKWFSFGRLEDFFDVPDQVFKDLDVGMSAPQKRRWRELPLEHPEPVVLVGKRHQAEQGIGVEDGLEEYKTAEVVELAKEFPKLLVFARYTAQIDALASALRAKLKGRDVLVLDGRTADRRALMEQAERRDRDTVVVAQSQVSTGYELPSFRCTVFASMSYSFVDYEQALGRTQRANAIAKNCYVHLVAGPVDRAILECVREKRDFNESLFMKQQQ